MKGSLTLVMLSTLLVISFSVALAENGNMTNNMTMPSITSMNMTKNATTPMSMTMPMKMPMKMAMPMNMPMNMTMPMKMPMNMPMNMSSGSSMNVIILQNVTLNVILAQNLTSVTNTITLPSMTNRTKIAFSALNTSKPIMVGKGT
jgi:hypothetical protein